ncbi:MAG: response regulator transcription factor [Spirochaetaceae bacterium]|nr:response regulator transcription factor [Spirochaetaceae bacterium]
MRILVIDDEAQIRRLLEIALASKGWEVLAAANGTEGLDAARALKPDVVLLDLNLPDMTGLETLLRLREWSSVPVVVVTVRDSEEDVVALLEAGADDYVTKPFYTNELAARIQAVHRRRSPDLGSAYRSGRLRFEFGSREAFVCDERLKLTPTEYAVLATLARSAGKIVTRDALLREVWGPAGEAEEGSLRVYVNSLRKKIEVDPTRPELLTTEARVGYRLRAPDPEEGE